MVAAIGWEVRWWVATVATYTHLAMALALALALALVLALALGIGNDIRNGMGMT